MLADLFFTNFLTGCSVVVVALRRVATTARAGGSGQVVSLVRKKDRVLAEAIKVSGK